MKEDISKLNKIHLNGVDYDNPLDWMPLKKRNGEYKEWQESPRISFRSIWLDHYTYDPKNSSIVYEAQILKISNRGKCFIGDEEIKKTEEIELVKEIFANLKVV